ncbi:agmatinase [Candidatus Bathyarchaeota archaeon]|jgi:agmatinase|nr:agmatinase [Candidatus Bathyarchaeota archaeon]MDP6049222.1 agmatinase [Candidatus Bathyarchaeota archaeon]|tara:strand:- start:121 stop:999 length:879 start_codon:yes stop_codon:yes gene_type:complete
MTLKSLLGQVLQSFLDTTKPLEEAVYSIFGAPLDATTSHRSGTRFAPDAIRRASLALESYSLRSGLDAKNIAIADIGNVLDLESVDDLGKIEETIRIIGADKIPVMIGGEHTISLASMRALKPDLVVSFDAHMDLRDNLFGEIISHSTFMRRAIEEIDLELVLVGSRAVSREEIEFVRSESRINVISGLDLPKRNLKAWTRDLMDWSSMASSIYITIDMDVVNPASAPAVGNPAPEGIEVSMLLDILQACMGAKVVGFDLTEVSPYYDSGMTAIQAAYIILECMYLHANTTL